MDDEYTIIEEPKKRPHFFPNDHVFEFERNVDEEEGSFVLEDYDARTLDGLSRFIRNGYEPYFSPHTLDVIFRRALANNIDWIMPAPDIRIMMDKDKASGIVLLCKQITMAVCGAFDQDSDDPFSCSSAFIKAKKYGILTKKQFATVDEMMDARRRCSYRIDVDLPSDETMEKWFETTLKIISRCYRIKISGKREENDDDS